MQNYKSFEESVENCAETAALFAKKLDNLLDIFSIRMRSWEQVRLYRFEEHYGIQNGRSKLQTSLKLISQMSYAISTKLQSVSVNDSKTYEKYKQNLERIQKIGHYAIYVSDLYGALLTMFTKKWCTIELPQEVIAFIINCDNGEYLEQLDADFLENFRKNRFHSACWYTKHVPRHDVIPINLEIHFIGVLIIAAFTSIFLTFLSDFSLLTILLCTCYFSVIIYTFFNFVLLTFLKMQTYSDLFFVTFVSFVTSVCEGLLFASVLSCSNLPMLLTLFVFPVCTMLLFVVPFILAEYVFRTVMLLPFLLSFVSSFFHKKNAECEKIDLQSAPTELKTDSVIQEQQGTDLKNLGTQALNAQPSCSAT